MIAAESKPPIEVTGYVIDAQVNPAAHTLNAEAKVTFTANQAADAAVFDLHGALRVTEVRDAGGASLNGERGANATVRVTPTQPLVAGQSYTYTFLYNGQLTGSEGGPVEGLKLASVDDPISYLLYAGRWFPLVGYTTDRFTAEMHVFVPAGYTVIGSGATNQPGPQAKVVNAEQAHRDAAAPATAPDAGPQLSRRGEAADQAPTTASEQRRKNGTEQPDEEADMPGRPSVKAKPAASAKAAGAAAKTAGARARRAAAAPPPITSTTQARSFALPGGQEFDFSWTKAGFPGTLVIGKFLPPVSEIGSPNIKVYTTAAHQDSAAAYADTANREFAFYTSTYGLPESNKLNIVELPDDTVPAAWAPEIAGIAGGRMANKSDARLLANTVAHQWWGSQVSPATLNDTWITNGMARYSELLYVEDQGGKPALQQAVLDVQAGALAYDTTPLASAGRLPVFSPEFQSQTLEKGAMVFHMLRWEVGDDGFLKIVKAVQTQFADKGIATSDFEKLAEGQTQQQLTAFFSQWLDGTGAPQFVNKYAVYRLGNDKGFRTIGSVGQDLDLFNMPIELQVQTEGKTEDKRVEVEGTSSQYVVDTFGSPRKIQIDPNNWILKTTPDLQVRVAILKGQQLVGQNDLG